MVVVGGRTKRVRTRLALAVTMVVCTAAAFAAMSGSALADLWVSAHGTDTGYCSQANPCASLARALSLAISPDTIYVGPGTFPGRIEINASDNQVTIQGAGMHATSLTEPAGQTGSVVTVDQGVTATLNDLSVSGGTATNGGGIFSDGYLTLERDLVAFNSADGAPPYSGDGGGVYDSGEGNIGVYDSEIADNQATDRGGGIFSGSVSNPTFDRDLIQGNAVVSSTGLLQGGGLWTIFGDVESDTVTGNEILTGNRGSAGDGGGVFIYENAFTVFDTVLDNHAAQNPAVHQSLGNINYSIVDSGCYGFNVCSLSSLMLGPPRDNGGPTPTIAITASSPAYDVVPGGSCAGTDQRGVSRLQLGASRCDAGAYQVSAPTTYVANPGGSSVNAYATGASGDAPPVLSLSGSATKLSNPIGVVTDALGDVFVANAGNNSITEYAPEATGNVAPTRTISGAATKLNQPQDLALDGAGHLWVTNYGGSVTEYAAGASGNAAPLARIAGSKTRLKQPNGIVIDPSGDVRVSNGTGAVLTFKPTDDGNVAPTAQLTSGKLTAPRGLNFDAAGHMLVADYTGGRVDTFAAGATGASTPSSTLTAPKGPKGLDLDLAGDVFAADRKGNAIDEFTPGGAQSTISGADTGLSSPAYLSEVPPPPAPHIKASTARRRSRARIVKTGVTVTVRASGKYAFRAAPVKVSAVARLKRRVLARSRTLALRRGRTIVALATTKQAPKRLHAHRRQKLTVTVTVRGGFGVVRRTLTVTSTG